MCAALLAGAACKALDSLITVKLSAPIATISMNAQASGAGFVTSPGAFFYRAVDNTEVQFTTVAAPADSCHVRQFGGQFALPIDTLPTAASPIDAGAYVSMRLSGRTDSLLPPSAQSVGYRLAGLHRRPFVPGDTVTFAIAGNSSGFPSSTVSMMTAEAFTMPSPRFPESGQPLFLTWTPATMPGSVMNFTIDFFIGPQRYQIYCQFADDGTAQIPPNFFTTFPNVMPSNIIPIVDAIRMRTALVQHPGSGAIVNVISVFEVPTLFSP